MFQTDNALLIASQLETYTIIGNWTVDHVMLMIKLRSIDISVFKHKFGLFRAVVIKPKHVKTAISQ